MEFTFLMETIKAIGYPALIFVIWYLTNKQSNKNMESLIGEYKFASKEMVKEMQDIASTLQVSYSQTSRMHSQLTRIELKIDQNQYCPIVRNREIITPEKS